MANGILVNHPSNYNDIDGAVWGWCWQANQANGHTLLTYSIPKDPTGYGYHGNGFEAFNATQRAAAVKILRMYDSVCNVDFQFTADPSQANIRMAEANSIIADGVALRSTLRSALRPIPIFFPRPIMAILGSTTPSTTSRRLAALLSHRD